MEIAGVTVVTDAEGLMGVCQEHLGVVCYRGLRRGGW